MKNKNAIFIFVVVSVIFSIAKVFFIKDFTVNREKIIVSKHTTPLEINDLKKIESFLKPANITSPNWEKLVDYRTNLKQTINLENAVSYFETANQNLPDLVICLRKDFCGMEPASLSSPYFDDERTPAHLLVARTLDVIKESLRLHPELASKVDWNLITEISGLAGNEVRASSMDLLVSFDVRNNGRAHLFEIAESYKGEAKAKFYSKMAKDLEPSERPVFISTLEKSLEQDDAHTVISIVEKLNTFQLSKNEVVNVEKVLCRFKQDDPKDPNWLMIKYNMSKLDNRFEQNCL